MALPFRIGTGKTQTQPQRLHSRPRDPSSQFRFARFRVCAQLCAGLPSTEQGQHLMRKEAVASKV